MIPDILQLIKTGTDLTAQVQVDSSALNRAGEQQIIYSVKGQ